MNDEPSNPEAAERKRAAEDLEDIQKLTKYAPFQRYYLRRLNDELHKAEVKVLDGRSLPSDQLHDAVVVHDTIKTLSKMIAEDEAGCRNVLANAPSEPTESEDATQAE